MIPSFARFSFRSTLILRNDGWKKLPENHICQRFVGTNITDVKCQSESIPKRKELLGPDQINVSNEGALPRNDLPQKSQLVYAGREVK